MPEPGFVWMRVGSWESKRRLVFTCPVCYHVNVETETIPPFVFDPEDIAVKTTFPTPPRKPRLGYCHQCEAFIRTPTDEPTTT